MNKIPPHFEQASQRISDLRVERCFDSIISLEISRRVQCHSQGRLTPTNCHMPLYGKGRRDSKSPSRVATMPLSLLRSRANPIKIRDFRISQAYPCFPIFLPEHQIPQGFGITGITPPYELQLTSRLIPSLYGLSNEIFAIQSPSAPLTSSWTIFPVQLKGARLFSQSIHFVFPG